MNDAAVMPPPPLSRWESTWRYLAALTVGGLLWISIAQQQWDSSHSLLYADVAGGAISFVAMRFRRRWPFAMAILVNIASAFSASAAGAAGITFISMATRRRWMEIIPVSAGSIVAGQVFGAVQPAQSDDVWWVTLAFGVIITGIAVAIGMYIGARRELLATLKDRAERAEREQVLRVSQAQTQERTRIAREMHDVLAHRMSLVAMHAGALAYRDNLTPEETRAAAEVIQANSHRALTDLREILGLLRDTTTDDVPNRPQPTLSDLEELIADERAAGARIQLDNDLPADQDVPESIGRTAYRFVQESLTNARKHAPSAHVDVIISGAAGVGLNVEVRNPIKVGTPVAVAPGGGFGLIGLAERATLAQGRFEHGRTAEGDFVVRVWLPWPA